MICKHKYVSLKVDSYYYRSGRYTRTYIQIATFFCEKCLDMQTVKEDLDISTDNLHNLPTWAGAITRHAEALDRQAY